MVGLNFYKYYMSRSVTVKVPSRSGFDKSFHNMLTTKIGTLTPILVDELIPNSTVHLRSAISAALPPLASDTFMNVNLKIEAFFVPTRLVYGGYEGWLTGDKVFVPNDEEFMDVKIPTLTIRSSDSSFYAAGTLSDYLGIKELAISSGESGSFNIFPYLCYHRIYDDWYRNAKIQTPVFCRPAADSSAEYYVVLSTLPFVSLTENAANLDFHLSDYFPDGVQLGGLRQRNFGSDYFTEAFPNAQLGDAKKVEFTIVDSKGSFTIPSLRAQNSLQQFSERNVLSSPRMQDYCLNNYGASLSSGVAQRAICLGSDSIPIYSKSVSQQGTAPESNNPFASVAAQYGDGKATGQSSLVDSFTAEEPGYFMVLASIVPDVTYASGIDRLMRRYSDQDTQVDLPNPILQNVGNQPIFEWELNSHSYDESDVFGYVDRYADQKIKLDQVHGLLRPGQSLSSFALTRSISGHPRINSNFLKIPTDFMDDVTAVTADISNYGVWIDCYHDYKVSQPLAPFAIPSLQDPAYEHGHDVNIQLNGSRL